MSLRLIPPGKMDAILLVVGPGLVGERDMLLVFTPVLEVSFGSATFSASITEASTPSDSDFLCFFDFFGRGGGSSCSNSA